MTSLAIAIINFLLTILINVLTQKEYFYELAEYYSDYTLYLALSQFITIAITLTITYKIIYPDEKDQICEPGGVF